MTNIEERPAGRPADDGFIDNGTGYQRLLDTDTQSVLVYGPWGCGLCHSCAKGDENNCVHGIKAPGIFRPGAMAEFMIVDDARHLVPLGTSIPSATSRFPSEPQSGGFW